MTVPLPSSPACLSYPTPPIVGETWVVGDLSPGEGRILKRLIPEVRKWKFFDPSRKEPPWRHASRDAETIFFARPRPGAIPDALVERAQLDAPDVEMISLCGAWCEGEVRTGSPWPGMTRLYWSQLPAWATRRRRDESMRAQTERPLVVVNTRDRETAAAWSDILDQLHYASVWIPRRGRAPLFSGPCLAIWDDSQLNGSAAEELSAFCRQMHGHSAPVLLGLHFPRFDEIETSLDLGVQHVFGKPFSMDEIEAALQNARQLPEESRSEKVLTLRAA